MTHRTPLNKAHIMSTASLDFRKRFAGILSWMGRGWVLIAALTVAIYGTMTIDSAISHYLSSDNPVALAKSIELREASESGKMTDIPPGTSKYSSAYIVLLGLVSSPTHGFGKGSLAEHGDVYASAPKINGTTLSLHILFGSFCLIFGGLQFWPAFRRRFPIWHRRIGVTYMVTVQISMIMSMVYLVLTPVPRVLDNLFFATGLWILAITVTASLWMSVYSLIRKQFAQHQAWMWINFGLLLSTPLQRLGWLTFGYLFPDRRWAETNYAVSDAVIPFAIICSYLLFTWTRRRQTMRAQATLPQRTHGVTGRGLALLLMPLLALSSYITVACYAFGQGIGSVGNAANLIPASVLANHHMVLSGSIVTRSLFVLATLMGLVSAGRFLWTAFIRSVGSTSNGIQGAWGLAAAGWVLGYTLLAWGIDLGLPSYATLSGGALTVLGGGACLLFSTALAYALLRSETAWIKEWGVFTLTCFLATPSFFLVLPVLGMMGFEAQFVSAGHLFRIAEAGQWLLILVPFVYAVYGQATQQRIAR